MEKELPRIFRARPGSPAPLAIEKSGAPPIPIGKSGDDCNDRQSQTDSGQRLGGHVWEMTDVNAVNNVVKDINELRKRHRNCKTQNISRDAALTKVMSVRRFCFW